MTDQDNIRKRNARLQQAILKLLREEGPMFPPQFFETMRRRSKADIHDIRVQMWQLITLGQVDLTRDLVLQLSKDNRDAETNTQQGEVST